MVKKTGTSSQHYCSWLQTKSNFTEAALHCIMEWSIDERPNATAISSTDTVNLHPTGRGTHVKVPPLVV